jgi:cysteine desulfurase/selenocysteine lyase
METGLEAYKKLLSKKTRIVSVNHASNSLGTINPIKRSFNSLIEVGALVLIDGAQAGAHLPIDVQELRLRLLCRFFAQNVWPTGTGFFTERRRSSKKCLLITVGRNDQGSYF